MMPTSANRCSSRSDMPWIMACKNGRHQIQRNQHIQIPQMRLGRGVQHRPQIAGFAVTQVLNAQ